MGDIIEIYCFVLFPVLYGHSDTVHPAEPDEDRENITDFISGKGKKRLKFSNCMLYYGE